MDTAVAGTARSTDMYLGRSVMSSQEENFTLDEFYDMGVTEAGLRMQIDFRLGLISEIAAELDTYSADMIDVMAEAVLYSIDVIAVSLELMADR